MRPPRVPVLLAIASAVTGCGLLYPTPARFHPPLPEPEPMPELRVEELIGFLEAEGLGCAFAVTEDLVDAKGNPHSGWTCRSGDQEAGDWMDVSATGGEDGPIESVGAHIFRDDGSAPELDDHATALFDSLVVSRVVPEEHRPTPEALLDGVRRNYPMELGGGWFLDFERSSISRSIRVIYSSGGT